MTSSAVPSLSLNEAHELCFKAFQAVLTHSCEFLTIQELGRFSVSFKSAQTITDDAGVWKKTWEQATAAGRKCEMEHLIVPSNHTSEYYSLMDWSGGSGLLPCFIEPDQQVLAKVGFKHASGCLLSKHCFRCGAMAAGANPLTFTRMRNICYYKDQGNKDRCIMNKTKAKSAFLLSEKDCKDLPSASFQQPGLSGDFVNSTHLLLQDVKAASFAKWGGADGLEAEFQRRTRVAIQRYNHREATGKPQKKRPKIEKMSHRPADGSVNSLRDWCDAMPIGTAYHCYERLSFSSCLHMTHSLKCGHCHATGTVQDIMLHQMFEHGLAFIHENEYQLATCPSPPGLVPLSELDLPDEMSDLMSTAQLSYREGNSHEEPLQQNAKFCDLRFDGRACNFLIRRCVDYLDYELEHSDENSEEEYSDDELGHRNRIHFRRTLEVFCQLEASTTPMKLLCAEIRGDRVAFAADNSTFERVKEALDLHETSSAQLLAVFISRLIRAQDTHFHIFTDGRRLPLYFQACDILQRTGRGMAETSEYP